MHIKHSIGVSVSVLSGDEDDANLQDQKVSDNDIGKREG